MVSYSVKVKDSENHFISYNLPGVVDSMLTLLIVNQPHTALLCSVQNVVAY